MWNAVLCKCLWSGGARGNVSYILNLENVECLRMLNVLREFAGGMAVRMER